MRPYFKKESGVGVGPVDDLVVKEFALFCPGTSMVGGENCLQKFSSDLHRNTVVCACVCMCTPTPHTQTK